MWLKSETESCVELAEVDWRELSGGPQKEGSVGLIVCRLPGEQRSCPEQTELSIERGLSDDRWSQPWWPNPDRMITFMNLAVAKKIAGSDERLAEIGDNFLVDFDLSEANLPPGTRVLLGDAELMITDAPHLGCRKFARRFGREAMKIVNQKEYLSLKLRGIYGRVIKPGRVWIGAPMIKLEDG